MKFLITGATGFIGKAVLEKLVLKYGSSSIMALSSREIEGIKTIPSNQYIFSNNYLLENGCGDVDVLIHVGAFIPKCNNEINNIALTTDNIVSTRNILDSNLPNLKKIIYISTVDVYANEVDLLNEQSLTIPNGLYGWSKLYCEKMIDNYCLQKSITYEILRLGHVYGPGEEKYLKVMPVMLQNAIQGKNLKIYGDGEAIRSFIFIDDVVDAIIKSISLCSSEVINIVGNEPVTINELANIIRSFTNDKVNIEHISSDTENKNYVFDNSKMRRLLLDELIPLKNGLRQEYDYLGNKEP